jgi:hypothetical protein
LQPKFEPAPCSWGVILDPVGPHANRSIVASSSEMTSPMTMVAFCDWATLITDFGGLGSLPGPPCLRAI